MHQFDNFNKNSLLKLLNFIQIQDKMVRLFFLVKEALRNNSTKNNDVNEQHM